MARLPMTDTEPTPLEKHAEFIAAYRRLHKLSSDEAHVVTVLVEVVEYAEVLEKLLKMVMKH